ncbi:MAG: DUF523 domain-containing protein [Deltaproteobacteria bacterium]|nr:DUF523 domain-containing protein [Candidatus Zymogenaceae bacterium]
MIYLVSACLVGINCRYDGANSYSATVAAFLDGRQFMPVCPEVLGGLGVPRAPCRFFGGDGQALLAGSAQILDRDGNDLSESFLVGANKALAIVCSKGITSALLNERSPSCGVREVYVGRYKVPGMGVLAALLVDKGIRVMSDEEPLI